MISYYSLFISSYSLFFPIFPIVSHYFLLFPIISPSLHAPLGLGLRGEQERERRGGAAVHRGFSGHSGEWKRSLAALQIVQTRGTKEAHHDGFCMIDEMRHDHE